VILQNKEDRDVIVNKLKVPIQQTALIRGAGVDLNTFRQAADPEGPPVVALVSRMLWNKGVKEFVEAAKLLRSQHVNARFVLVGDSDVASPSGIPRNQLSAWNDEGVVEWWGRCTDMASVYQKANVVCLPSHGGEGVPKSLLEAAACGRAIVTTDVPGCRDAVRHNENGLLVPPRTVAELASAIRTLVESPSQCRRMGAAGRALISREFSEQSVVKDTLFLYDGTVEEQPSGDPFIETDRTLIEHGAGSSGTTD
jgi:glycosyltransferase involved in cell wall biosynthesis